MQCQYIDMVSITVSESSKGIYPLIKSDIYNAVVKRIVDTNRKTGEPLKGESGAFISVEVEIDNEEKTVLPYNCSLKMNDATKLGDLYQKLVGKIPPKDSKVNLDSLIGKKVKAWVGRKQKEFNGNSEDISIVEKIERR